MLKLNAQHRLTVCMLCWGHSLDTLSTLRTLLAVCTLALCPCLVQPHQRQWDCAVLIHEKRQPNNIQTGHEYVSRQTSGHFLFLLCSHFLDTWTHLAGFTAWLTGTVVSNPTVAALSASDCPRHHILPTEPRGTYPSMSTRSSSLRKLST